ncbi:MAG TPA: tetratricopeptide repeat protein [Gemmataceae bacterium]|nr:tetratricopeptide repeat protein [Gemmataceae bacterium]
MREAETKAVLEFIEKKILAAARPEGQAGGLGRDVTLRRALEAAQPLADQSFSAQPLIEARLRLTLATSFRNLGEGKLAADQAERARTIYSRHLGPDHPDTLASMSNLAIIYDALGRHADALKLCEETRALMRAKLGPDHPQTLSAMNNLALSYATLGRQADALKLHEETLALKKAKLGPDNPSTLASMNNFALTYSALGRHAEALKLGRETLALMKAKLGPDHPCTLGSMDSLALIYNDLGRYGQALKLYEETLALMKAKLGPDHPKTLMCMHYLAFSYSALGRHAEELKLREETLELRKAKLGAGHPDTLFSMWGVAASLIKLKRGAEAIPVIDECFRRAAESAAGQRFLGLADERLRYFEKARDAAGCRTTADLWEKLNCIDPGSFYNAARYRAVTAAVLRAADPSPTAARLANAELRQAMTWLQKAVAAGYKDAEHMKVDTDLDALRDREDFRKLLAELEAGKPREEK